MLMQLVRSTTCWLVVRESETSPLETLAYQHGYRFSSICDALSCDPRRLHHIFIRDLGLAPKEWLKSERMAAACRMLEGGCWPAKAARLLGFATASNFGREFIATYGNSPGKYREQALAFEALQPKAVIPIARAPPVMKPALTNLRRVAFCM